MPESKHTAKVQMVEGSLWKNVPKFAIPVALTGSLGQLFNAADIAVVGRFTGEQGTQSMAAVGANSAIVGLILNLFMGIALGANVVIATALGRKDEETVKQAVGTSVLLFGPLQKGSARLRNAVLLDPFRIPAPQDFPDDHAGLSNQPWYHGSPDPASSLGVCKEIPGSPSAYKPFFCPVFRSLAFPQQFSSRCCICVRPDRIDACMSMLSLPADDMIFFFDLFFNAV